MRLPCILVGVAVAVTITAGAHTRSDELESSGLPHGQGAPNLLRHFASQSNLPDQFGRKDSMILSRNVVSKSGIWASIDAFTRAVHRYPNVLDWLVVDVGLLPGSNPQVVTLNAAYACIDQGKSTTRPIQFSPAKKLGPELNQSDNTGYIWYSGPSSDNPDIVTSCLKARRDFNATQLPVDGYFPYQVEYKRVHQGEPVQYVPLKTIRGSYLDDADLFERFRVERRDASGSLNVIYDSVHDIPLVVGLPFVTGFRMYAKDVNGFRVPQLPLSGVHLSVNGRLNAFGVGRQTPPTTAPEVWLNLQSNGLPLVVALFFAVNMYVQAFNRRATRVNQLPVRMAVQGIRERWDFTDAWLFIFTMFSALILAAPIALAAVEGKLDPRPHYEVTTGAGVFYGVVQQGPDPDVNFSIDKDNNPYSGAPFIVSSWMSVRTISDGHWADLIIACVLVLLVMGWVLLGQTREMSASMPAWPGRYPGISFWKSYGFLSLLYDLRVKVSETPRYMQLFIRLRGDALRDSSSRALAAVNIHMREAALKYLPAAQRLEHQRMWDALADRVQVELRRRWAECGDTKHARVELVANVKMDNHGRFAAMMARTKAWFWRIPREWEYLTRGALSIVSDCKNMNWYRTWGRRAPDEVLALAKLGLLEHMDHVERVLITEDEDRHGLYDKDSCHVMIGLVPSRSRPRAVDLPNGPRFERKNRCSGFDPQNPLGKQDELIVGEHGMHADLVMLSDEIVRSDGPELPHPSLSQSFMPHLSHGFTPNLSHDRNMGMDLGMGLPAPRHFQTRRTTEMSFDSSEQDNNTRSASPGFVVSEVQGRRGDQAPK